MNSTGYKNFINTKEAFEKKANEIAKRMVKLNGYLIYGNSFERCVFFDDSIEVVSSGNFRGYYEDSIDVPVEFMCDDNWEEKYVLRLANEKEKKEASIKADLDAKAEKKKVDEIAKLTELKLKYPNL